MHSLEKRKAHKQQQQHRSNYVTHKKRQHIGGAALLNKSPHYLVFMLACLCSGSNHALGNNSSYTATSSWWSPTSTQSSEPLDTVRVLNPPDMVIDHPHYGKLNFYRLPHKVNKKVLFSFFLIYILRSILYI